MSESHVTQCPHCRTSFRVSQAQLAAAHGAVRCGACLHVFNAAQHLFGTAAGAPAAPADKPQPQSQPPGTSKPAPAKDDDDTLWIHDDLDLDSLDLDEELAKLEEQEQQLSQQFLDLAHAPRSAEGFAGSDSPARDEPHDEAWAEALLRDEPTPGATFELQRQAHDAAAEPPADSTPPASPPVAPEGDDAEALEPPLGNPAADADDDEPAAGIAPAATKPARSEPGLSGERLFELDDEPLQLDWRQPQARPWGRWFAWSLLILLAAGGLLAQYATYNFAELARQDRYRPWFEQLCPKIGCRLPSKVDISQIRSSNLVVRSHPEFSGALIVDAILYNRAPFAQPFPLLEIRFADLGGQLIASRRFKPSEYLAGELAGQSEMPPQTPIHIAMDILDPGTRAVNYSLSFHSPE